MQFGHSTLRGNSVPLLLGHRGARHYAAENTIPAFELALEHGCDGFECDVRSTADGQAILCHDPFLAGCAIARTHYDNLQERAPNLASLEEVLERFAGRCYLYLEIKVAGLEDCVFKLLEQHPPQHGFVMASFLPEVIEAFASHARGAGVPLGFICDKRRELARWRDLPVQVVMPKHTLITPDLVKELHANEKQVFVWTVNQEREMHILAAAGVDGLVSDDTALLRRVLRKK
jgi:glycerophosphoryl diester phosphodiesterase